MTMTATAPPSSGARFVILEEHLAYGGLASRVAAVIADHGIRLTAFARPGIPRWAPFGDDEELHDKHGSALSATVAATRRMIVAGE